MKTHPGQGRTPILRLDRRNTLLLLAGGLVALLLSFSAGVLLGPVLRPAHQDALESLFAQGLVQPDAARPAAPPPAPLPSVALEPRAEAALQNLQSAQLGEPAGEAGEGGSEPAQDDPSAAAPGAGTHFTLQVSSFQDRHEADALVRQLRGRGYNPYLVEGKLKDGSLWYRVRLGKFGDRRAAEAFLARFREQEQLPGFISTLR